jgi:hypothetical protein
MTIMVELPPEIEERFLAEARVRGLTLGAYVQEFLVRSGPATATTPALPTDELNRLLDEAADLVPSGPSLSDSAMSRESMYTREDEW